jgi:hypothetical protein
MLAVTRSPRGRRRLVRIVLATVALTALVATLVLLPKGEPLPPERFSKEPARLYVEREHVDLTRADRRGITAALQVFVESGLARRAPERAWDVATPAFRGGQTRGEWARGILPVAPYDSRAGDARAWRLDWAYPGEANVELFLHPGKTEARGPIAFYATLKRAHGRWLVDSMQPAATFSPVGEKARVLAQVDFQRGELGSGAGEAKLASSWLLVPVGLLSLALVVPLAVAIRKRNA